MKKVLFILSVLISVASGTQSFAFDYSQEGDLVAVYSDSLSGGLNTSVVANEWSVETDLPGLGLKDVVESSQAYTVLCNDGVTTLGIYYDGSVYVTGINTTASEVSFPTSIIINGVETGIDYFGLSGNMDWSGAPNLTKLHLYPVRGSYADFTNSKITDIYLDGDCYFNNRDSTFSYIYLHIPYGYSRNDYDWYGFKRILVGNEQPEYPVPSYSQLVVAGENEGEYFGISELYGSYCIVEIFTSNDSVALPSVVSINNVNQNISTFGADGYYNYGALCANAPNLKTVKIPSSYSNIEINWSYNPIVNLYMQGDAPYTNWSLLPSINVYIAQSYYFNYKNNSNWNSASILPDGWDFEWMTVHVERKGEFAQTYIEMTDANWDLGMYVKITGSLNENDLENIKNLTNLTKLDLSEAEFVELPSSFMYDKYSLKEVVLPEMLTSISSSAFYGCIHLQKVIAQGVKILYNYAFYNCKELSEFDISNVTSIGDYAFYRCTVFNPAKLSSDLEVLGSYAFSSSGITEVTIPENIMSLHSGLFSDCQQLQRVILPNTITSIEYSVFYNCPNLIEINIPEGVTSIGSSAFYDCSSITEITLPSTLQSIGYGVFENCTALATVKCKAVVPPVTNGNFTNNVDLNHCTLYIAPFAIDAYRAAECWDDFYIMKPLNEPVKNIYINRPMTFDLLSEDNAVLQENPNMTLDCNFNSNSSVGQLSASGDGTLSAGIFSISHRFYNRDYYGSSDLRTTLINNAENMRADSVMCSINFEKNRWHFISFQYDVRMEDIFGLNNTDFVVRQYNSINRASGDGTENNWENVPADGVLEAGKGYIIQAANNSYDENGNSQGAVVCFPSRNTITKNNLFTSDNIIVPLEEYPAEFAHNRSWNLVGNPYPCYFDMHYLMDDFTTPIVLWKGSSYQAYSPVDDDIILRPNEAFFVQRPIDTEQMVFGADGRMHYDEACNAEANPGIRSVPAIQRGLSNRSVFNFNIEGCGRNDRARIVMNEEATLDYELNCDACKFFAETSDGVEIYVDGTIKYDICERPFADGKAALGMRMSKDGDYTISLTSRSAEGWNVILKDKQTGALVDLTESSYQFEAKSGESQNRFELTFKTPETTSIDKITSSENNASVRIVNTVGVTVYEGNLADFKSIAKAGVYLVIDSGKTYKIAIK